MASWYVAVILGVVEGLTEFLPVSSTGHLILAGHLLDFTGPKAETFDIVIQLGAILAVLTLYLDRFTGLLKNDPARPFSGVRGLWLLFLTSLPASLLGLATHKYIKAYLFNPTAVACALGVGAVMILVVESVKKPEKTTSIDEITPAQALGVGLFQCLALWPGFSRSAATIMGGMLLGMRRTVAAEYSFIAAVPIMFAATGYDFLKNYNLFEREDMIFLGIGLGVSFIAAWVAIKGFIYLLGRLTLRPFALYRLALVPLIFLFW
ncbi:undecaprenyl-diphosphate phosphatase [Pseudodesulfovibrio sp. F-1]|uniref:Undecaprenyl-diphosphatase n=1 Tax=Pseudodesulfovibrio alkaliphilus TaxID=2661613 RepID=A0A7K1KQB5_9BACT|nr:undecaprenyl-diphosphate phosphatase [Pseudodesulfovibrio alkaliphilus]MUM78288.1 undecaprenyl-diphosphate phosphatase [Pseudodesulfovibrio alkaliphilus]